MPTLWIGAGPAGPVDHRCEQSRHPGAPRRGCPFSTAFQAPGLVYSLPVWGFAKTSWSFTFPVGTVVTGTSGLAAHSGDAFFAVAAVVVFIGLVTAWATVAVRTAHGVLTGQLLR